MPQRSAYRWVCLGLLFFSGLLAFFVRLAPAVAIPDLQCAFSLDAVELGLLTALYLWPFALMQPMAEMLVDAFGARRTVTVFLVIAGTGQVVFALAPSFSMALLGRAFSGLGAATLYVGTAKIMARWFRSKEFGTLTGAWTSSRTSAGSPPQDRWRHQSRWSAGESAWGRLAWPWPDPRSLSARGGARSGGRLPDTLLVQLGLGGAQRRAGGIQSGASEDRPLR